MGAAYSHTTRSTGTTLTAAIYNGDHQNHIDNGTPQMHDDYSANAAQMQITTSPGTVGAESLATSLAGELERLRHVIKTLHGGAQWYPGVALTIMPVVDTTAIVKGSVDASKTLRFEVDGFTTATERVITPPDSNVTLLGTVIGFAAGTRMLFQQTTAPTGWTKEVAAAYDDSAMRIVTGAAGTGGADAFSTHFGTGKSTAGFTLTTGTIPAHAHSRTGKTGSGVSTEIECRTDTTGGDNTGSNTGSTGGGGSHAHTLSNFNIKFADCIIAQKD